MQIAKLPRFPYGVISDTGFVFGFTHTWSKETAQWFAKEANLNPKNVRNGVFRVVPLPGVGE